MVSVKADETFITISYKGNQKNFNLPRSPHKQGIAATRRGLSKRTSLCSCWCQSEWFIYC